MTDIVHPANQRARIGGFPTVVLERWRDGRGQLASHIPADVNPWRLWGLAASLAALVAGATLAWGPPADLRAVHLIGVAVFVAGPLALIAILTFVPSDLELEARSQGIQSWPRPTANRPRVSQP